jgi:hypothetical protein
MIEAAMNTIAGVSFDRLPIPFPRIPLKDIDPYAIWVLMTGGKGLASWDGSADTPPADALVVLELEAKAAVRTRGGQIRVQNAYPLTAKYVTAVAKKYSWVALLFEEYRKALGIQRFELGMPVRYPTRTDLVPPPAPPVGGNVIGIVDYGCPFAHGHFKFENDVARVAYLWDQGRQAHVPSRERLEPSSADWKAVVMPTDEPGFAFEHGAELRGSDTSNKNIQHLFERYKTPSGVVDEEACYEAIGYTLMRENATHGSHVMDVAAGWPNPLVVPVSDEQKRDIAGAAQIIFVQFPRDAVGDTSGGSMNAHVLDALRFIELRTKPDAQVVVNVSYGTFAGPHDGTTLLEKAIDELICERLGRFDVTLPAGNSFNAACHARLELTDSQPCPLLWEVMADDPTDSFMEVWYDEPQSKESGIEISVCSPDGSAVVGPVGPDAAFAWYEERTSDPLCTVIHVVRASGPYDMSRRGRNCVLIALAPTRSIGGVRGEAPHGIWTVSVQRVGETNVTVDAWIERDDPALDLGWGNRQSRFIVAPQEDEGIDYPDASKCGPTKFGTLNTYAVGARARVAGGCRVDDEPDEDSREDARSLADYTAAGFRDEQAHRGGPDLVAPSDRSEVLTGRLAAGTRSGATLRMDGTSVASPQLARAVANGDLQVKLRPNGKDDLQYARWGAGTLAHGPSDE